MCVQGGSEDPTQAQATVFVWLRYSAARQLTWQRNYNTQPRILGDAQARLTGTIAKVRHASSVGCRSWGQRLLLSLKHALGGGCRDGIEGMFVQCGGTAGHSPCKG